MSLKFCAAVNKEKEFSVHICLGSRENMIFSKVAVKHLNKHKNDRRWRINSTFGQNFDEKGVVNNKLKKKIL